MLKKLRNSFASLSTSSLVMMALVVVLLPLWLLCLSIDSPCYEMWGRIDSSWFFTSGKAWMNGLVPYVDFTDSKGPLLWLIYGVGYLLSHYNYVGIWVITCVAYVVTTMINYRTVRLFVRNRWLSFTVAMLMMAVYFNAFIHYETRPEDFCQPFIALSLWAACRLAYGDRTISRFKFSAWMIGISIGATLLIKFTLSLMVSFYAIMLCVVAKRSGIIHFRSIVGRLLAGVLLVCLPFVVTFAIMGNLDDFVREYFIMSSKISSHSPRLNIIKWVLQGGFLSGLIIVMCASTSTMFLHTRKYAWMPIAAFFWFLLITIQNAEWVYYYYSCMIFGLFGLIAVAKWLERFENSKVLMGLIVTLSIVAISGFSFIKASSLANFKPVKHEPDSRFDTERVEYYRHVAMVKRVEQPRFVFYNCNNVINVADETGGLPGCKYFAKQFGATSEMIESQYDDIKRNRPHFVYVKNVETECLKRIEDLGYFIVLEPGEFFKVYLLASPELQGLNR